MVKKITLGIVVILGVVALIATGYKATDVGISRLNPNEITWLNALAATTTASNIVVSKVPDFNLLGITVAPTTASGTLRFACSMADTQPTFTSSQSASNRWDYVDVTDLEDEASIDGDTGFVFTNSTTVRQFLIDNATYRWCTAMLSPWTAGSVTVKVLPTTAN